MTHTMELIHTEGAPALLNEIETVLAETEFRLSHPPVSHARGDRTLRLRRRRGYLMVARIRAEAGHENAALELMDRIGLDGTISEFHN